MTTIQFQNALNAIVDIANNDLLPFTNDLQLNSSTLGQIIETNLNLVTQIDSLISLVASSQIIGEKGEKGIDAIRKNDYPLKVISGNKYAPQASLIGSSIYNSAAFRVHFVPFMFDKDITIDKLCIYVNNNAVSNVLMGIYSVHPETNRPDELLCSTSLLTSSGVAASILQGVVDNHITLNEGEVYYVACQTSTTTLQLGSTMSQASAGSFSGFFGLALNAHYTGVGFVLSLTSMGLPSSVNPTGMSNQLLCPHIVAA